MVSKKFKVEYLNTNEDEFFVKKMSIDVSKTELLQNNLHFFSPYEKQIFIFFKNKLQIEETEKEYDMILTLFKVLSKEQKISQFSNLFFKKILETINKNKQHDLQTNKKNIKTVPFENSFYHKHDDFLLNVKMQNDNYLNLIFNF